MNVEGVGLSLFSGFLIGVGHYLMSNTDKLLTEDEEYKKNVIQNGLGSGCFTFGLYLWVPPLFRRAWSIGFDPAPGLAIQFIGIGFAGMTGLVLGTGYGIMKCRNNINGEDKTVKKRIAQVALGTSIFISGIFAASPAFLKLLWVASYWGDKS